MVDLLELGRQAQWHHALDTWFERGSLEPIIALLRENRPMRDAEARFVAAIFAGELKHWGARGGPSYRKRWRTQIRNAELVRPLFKRVLKIKQRRAKRHPEMRIDARSEALEYLSVFLRGGLSPDAVKKIVEEPNARYFFVTPVEVKAALAALWKQFEKKPDEVL